MLIYDRVFRDRETGRADTYRSPTFPHNDPVRRQGEERVGVPGALLGSAGLWLVKIRGGGGKPATVERLMKGGAGLIL